MLSAVVEEEELQLNTPRVKTMKELGSRILKKITEGETEMSHFDDFSMEIVSALKGLSPIKELVGLKLSN